MKQSDASLWICSLSRGMMWKSMMDWFVQWFKRSLRKTKHCLEDISFNHHHKGNFRYNPLVTNLYWTLMKNHVAIENGICVVFLIHMQSLTFGSTRNKLRLMWMIITVWKHRGKLTRNPSIQSMVKTLSHIWLQTITFLNLKKTTRQTKSQKK